MLHRIKLQAIISIATNFMLTSCARANLSHFTSTPQIAGYTGQQHDKK